MANMLDLKIPFGDARNPRGFGISSDGMRFCGTFPSWVAGMADYAFGYVIGWSPAGLFHVRRMEDPAYVGISCRGINRAGDVVGFVTEQTMTATGEGSMAMPAFTPYPFYWPATGSPVVFRFADAKSASSSRAGPGDAMMGINDQGEVVGSYVDKSGLQRGYVARIANLLADPTAANPGTLTYLTLMRPTGTATRAPAPIQPRGINNKGVIVGNLPADKIGFVTVDRVRFTAVIVDNSDTAVGGINDYGEIVGDFSPAAGEQHGFRWQVDPAGQPTGTSWLKVDYDSILPDKTDLRTQLNGIDNFGTAIGFVMYTTLWSGEVRYQPILHRGGERAAVVDAFTGRIGFLSLFP